MAVSGAAANLATPNGARPLFLHNTTPSFSSLEPHFINFSKKLRPNFLPAAASSSSSSSVYPSAVAPVSGWTLDSWQSKKAQQLPEYPDPEELQAVLETLHSFPPIVFAGEARRLEEWLGKAAKGEAFLLQGGDCAESFKEFNAVNIRDTFRVLLQMAITLIYGAQMPVIKVFPFILLLLIKNNLRAFSELGSCIFFVWVLGNHISD